MPEGRLGKVVALVVAVLTFAAIGTATLARSPAASVAQTQVRSVAPHAPTTEAVAEIPTTIAPAPVTAAPPVTVPPTTAAPAPTTTAAPAPAVAAATTPEPAPFALTVQERGEAALGLLASRYPIERLGYKIRFEAGRDGLLGVANSSTKVISIYIRDSHDTEEIARTLAHEMGHAVDFTYITPAEVEQYIAIRGINATADTWFGCDGCTDYQTAAGDFAEVFQYWLVGPGQFLSQMGPPPTAEQLAQLEAIFAPSK